MCNIQCFNGWEGTFIPDRPQLSVLLPCFLCPCFLNVVPTTGVPSRWPPGQNLHSEPVTGLRLTNMGPDNEAPKSN